MTERKPFIPVRLERRVWRFIQEHRLLARGEKVVVGVSGGADSVCLLRLLLNLKDRMGIELHAAHLNHGLRGAAADADQQYVAELCRSLGVPLSSERLDVAASRARHSPIEEAARDARYAFFARVARSAGARRVAVGHSFDDHVETVLLHLIRGAGVRGLKGLEPCAVWGGEKKITVVRPLLGVRRAETAAYCRAMALEPKEDATNLSMKLLRNRVRLELIPLLRQYNPGIESALARAAGIAGEESRALDAWAASLWPAVAKQGGGQVLLNRPKMRPLPAGIQAVLMRQALEALGGSPRDIEAEHISALVRALDMPAGNVLHLLHGVTATVEYDDIVLWQGQPVSPFPRLDEEYTLSVPGETLIPGWRVTATVAGRSELRPEHEEGGPPPAYLDLERADTPLTVRGRRPGDRFQPLGMEQSKKLQDFMVDARIPRHWRDHVPLVCSPLGIVWVMGWRIDERARVTDQTRQVLKILFQRAG